MTPERTEYLNVALFHIVPKLTYKFSEDLERVCSSAEAGCNIIVRVGLLTEALSRCGGKLFPVVGKEDFVGVGCLLGELNVLDETQLTLQHRAELWKYQG